jgi:hypothetical protein
METQSASRKMHTPRVGIAILGHLISSARNSGCAVVEVTDPLAGAETTLLSAGGFARRGALLDRATG